VAQLPRHPCPVCGRSIAATTTSLSVAWREGKLTHHYVYLRTHNNPEGQRCPGTHATVEPPTQLTCSPNERTTP
jgi:hypothetical protein